MRVLAVLALAVSCLSLGGCGADETPTAQSVVAHSPQEVFASLDELYSEIEQKAATRQTVTGDPPYPVKFTFAKDDGRMLSLTGTAGFRSVSLTAWVDPADTPDKSVVRVRFEPESLLEKSGHKDDAYRALKITLEQTSHQFIAGQRIVALFGGTATPPK